ncbi:lipopolysaccharide kinase InaA family protein [Cryptosporangium phraense]|uniref:Molecular chaperone DnaJ n=1 Tax=Cryptosporangium phraense TaxID=2593070 RepID=A0A545B255_9ACTN|nr:lipopolysaccharide kinase InaA family protein [Cryptosporangium phraense]TQS46935.1 molecular chaperone DnaJ [Cryptosporangium phraense]
MTDFEDAVHLIFAAETITDADYRRLRRIVHPDAAPLGSEGIATSAFTRLTELWESRIGPYTVLGDPITGDLADLFRVRSAKGTALLKVARDPADNDLLETEAAVLRRRKQKPAFFPRLFDTLVMDDDGDRRAANVLEHCAGFVSLAEVERAYPDGLDPRDAAWMWRRLLVALGAAHRAGVVHGAVLPEHVLIHPAEHGLVIVDWCYAVIGRGPIPALVARYRDAYPPEVPAKEPATPATDLYLASGLMLRLMGPRVHPALRRFADGCRLARPRMRPQDAWRLLAELDDLLHRLYGPRRFREFSVPA